MHICCLNLGGVCTATYDCLRNWLDNCPFDVVLLQEIHFGMGRESLHWHSRGWSFITSVDPVARFSGVVVLIRNTIAHTDCIRYQELVKDRLLHVRLFPTQKVACVCRIGGIYKPINFSDSRQLFSVLGVFTTPVHP